MDGNSAGLVITDVALWAAGAVVTLITGAFAYTHHRINTVRAEIEARMERMEDDQKERTDKLWEAIDGLRDDLKQLASKGDLHREIDRLAHILSPRHGSD
jgi:uncharacterized protein YicC (UPF0701 family)